MAMPCTLLNLSSSRPTLDLPHDIIKSCLDYLTKREYYGARLVNKKWSAAVADCAECSVEVNPLHGMWTPQNNKELRFTLCCFPLTTETFQTSIREIVLNQRTFKGDCTGLEKIQRLNSLKILRSTITNIGPLSGCTALTDLKLNGCRLPEAGIAELEMIPTLVELNLAQTTVKAVSNLSKCKTLKVLNLSQCEQLTDDGIVGLERIPSLEELDLTGVKIVTVGPLSACKALKRLNLSGCVNLVYIAGLELIPTLEVLNLTGTAVPSVANLSASQSLKRIILKDCLRLTLNKDAFQGLELVLTLEELALPLRVHSITQFALPLKLKCLDLENHRRPADFFDRALQPFSTLEDINLGKTAIENLTGLSACTGLKKLNLHRCEHLATNSILQLDKLFPVLEDLNLSRTRMRNVTSLSRCKNLKKLNIAHCRALDDAAVLGLEAIPTLEELDLSGTGVTNVSRLSVSKTLKTLSLAGCLLLTSDGVRGLEMIPTLETFSVCFTGVSDLTHLRACKALKFLDASGCQNLTDAGTIGLDTIPTLKQLNLSETETTQGGREFIDERVELKSLSRILELFKPF